jgi:hypothetical protein
MRIILISGLLTVVTILGASAQTTIPQQMRTQQALNDLSHGATDRVGNVVYGVPAPPGLVVGDEYLDNKWNVGNLMMQSGELFERYKVRYDLKNQNLEIESLSGVKVIDSKMIRSVVWRDSETEQTRYFVTAKEFKLDDAPLIGILEVLIDGPVPLLRRHTLAIKKPDYNAALDVGSRDTKIYKKSTLYFAQNNVLTEVKGKKWPAALFGEHNARMEEFMEANKLGVKDNQDVITIFEYYNALLGGSAQP